MESLFEFGLSASKWLQAMYPERVDVMLWISNFGRFEFYLIILPLIYWCIDKRLGIHLSYMLVLSGFLNSIFKHMLRSPRPYWLDSNLQLTNDADYGLPSGHTQTAVVATLFLAGWLRKGWLWGVAFFYIFLVGLSRIYLAAHFVHDVLLGGMVGVMLLVGYLLWKQFGANSFRHRIFGLRLWTAILAPIVVFTLYVMMMVWLRGAPNTNVSWEAAISKAEQESFKSTVQMVSLLIGMGAGFTVEKSRLYFQVDGVFWVRGIRYLVGIVITVVLLEGLGSIFAAITPPDTLWLALPLRFIRYLILGVWLSYYAPLTFVTLGLAGRSTEPEMPFTVEGASVKESKE